MKWLGAAGWLLSWGDTTIALDPFFHRPPQARPNLPITRDELPPIDHLLVTHAHWDHFADTPYLAVTNARHTYVPKAAVRDLRREWRRRARAERRRGPDNWRAVVGGERIDLDGLQIEFHRIGRERFDLEFTRDALSKLRRGGNLRDWYYGFKFLATHLYGECFAISLTLRESGRRLCFFGNLPPIAAPMPQVLEGVDVAVLPYCPANGDWCEESIAVARKLRPSTVLMHHFDQFLPPVTVGLDLARYRERMLSETPIERIVVPKFFSDSSLETLLLQMPTVPIVRPPSMTRTSPVTKDAASEHR